MSKYWPCVLWFDDVRGASFKYVPSWAHHRKYSEIPGFDTYRDAFAFAQLMCGPTNTHKGGMSMFRPYVLEADKRPEFHEHKDTMALMVTRIAINEDGIIAPEIRGNTQE